MARHMKKHITILCGGRSCEHDISLLSTNNVIQALDQTNYHLTIIYISHASQWHHIPLKQWLGAPPKRAKDIELSAYHPIMINTDHSRPWFDQHAGHTMPCNVVIPMLHGQFGEDGAVQGLLEILNIPYVGAGVLSSALCMDKTFTKTMLNAFNIDTSPFMVTTQNSPVDYQQVRTILGKSVFVKPANSGSSIGINKVTDEKSFNLALKEAFYYDHKVMIEQTVVGREIECAVLGNEQPEASLPGEIICKNSFYSFEAKYLDDHAVDVVIPADLTKTQITNIQKIALKTYRILECEGLARVDVFLTESDDIYVNEVNTLPGFTDISLYPKAWEHAGLNTPALLEQLIELAIERHEKREALQYNADKKRAS